MALVIDIDSHIQRIILATEETTVTQQVSHRPIKCQSRLWSQRDTKVNESYHGDNPLLRPTGIQIATKSYADLQAMAPTNIKQKKNWNTEVHGGGGLELVKPARESASSRPKPCASLKKPHESCPFAAPCGPRSRKKNDRGQTSAFPSETSRFKPVIFAHRGSALPWLVDDRAAPCLHRIWCVPTR